MSKISKSLKSSWSSESNSFKDNYESIRLAHDHVIKNNTINIDSSGTEEELRVNVRAKKLVDLVN